MSKIMGSFTSRAPISSSPRYRQTCLKAVCILSTAVSSETAFAQAVLEEIVVTAEKREQNVQDIPLSVTAFSGQSIRDLGLTRPMDLAAQVPGVTLKSPNGDSSPIFTIRGIGISDFTVSNNSATSIYVDQVVKPYYPLVNFALFDLERVEVLKGPQGTLYGRNNTGGAITFVTRKPTSETEAFVRLDYSRYDTYDIEGAVGGALTDTLNGRFAVTTRQREDGYQDNRFDNQENGEIDRYSGRVALAWQATQDLEVNFSVQYGSNDSDVPLFKLAPPFEPTDLSIVCAPAMQGDRARDGSCADAFGQFDPFSDVDNVNASNSLGSGIDEDSLALVLTMDWALDGAIITAVTGYDDHDREEYQDFDASPLIAVDNGFHQQIDSFTQELRIASDGSHPFYWIAGVYYSDDSVDNLQTINALDLFGGVVNMDWEMETESYAVFGQVEYPLSNTWELVGGLRYTYEERSFDGGTIPQNISFLPTVLVDNDTDADEVTGKLGLNYRPSDGILLYGSVSKGFKSGGFNGAFATTPTAYTPYDPETIYAYEIGLKSTLLKRTLQFNAAAYYYDWQDFQATIGSTDPLTNIPIQILTNAGDAEVMGIETDIKWQATDRLTLMLGMAWSDGEIVSGQLDGSDLANNPDFSANALGRYEQPVDALNGSLFAQVDVSYTTEYDTRIIGPRIRPLVVQDDFWLSNARAGYITSDGKMEVAAWVRNIGDERYLVEVFDQGSLNTLDLYSEPRTYGISFLYNF